LKDELDGDAKQGLEQIRKDMSEIYPDYFLVLIPTAADRTKQKSNRKPAVKPATKVQQGAVKGKARNGRVISTPLGKIDYP
jgi:hypothetical protein